MLVFPKDKVTWALFKGIEQEGPNKGANTLFVVGDAPLARIIGYLDLHNIDYIYFGAGGRFDFNKQTIASLIAHKKIYCITIESPSFDFAFFKNLRYHHPNVVWVIPYIWNNTFIDLGFTHLRNIASMNYPAASSVYAKVDASKQVILHRMSETFVNIYTEGYSKDTLLEQEER